MGSLISMTLLATYIVPTVVIGDYLDYRKAHGKLQFQVFVMQNSSAILNYKEHYTNIEKAHEGHLLCQLPEQSWPITNHDTKLRRQV